jgi:mannose-6-phosphate isomerase-like protein (cupin superfamily)
MITEKPWGYYKILYENYPEFKVKELVVNPRSFLSLQRHRQRSEQWTAIIGDPTVLLGSHRDLLETIQLKKHQMLNIPVGHWHQLRNDTNYVVKVLEIQFGESCEETDIERITRV